MNGLDRSGAGVAELLLYFAKAVLLASLAYVSALGLLIALVVHAAMQFISAQ